MARTFLQITFAAVLPCAALAQTAFNLADVHSSPRDTWAKTVANAMTGGILNGDRYELHRTTMLDLIVTAYGVDADKVYGGPPWLDYDRFEIIAKAAPGTPPPALRQMLQALLKERFKLAVKTDTQPLPAYVLSVMDQSKLKTAEGAGGGCQSLPTAPRTSPTDQPTGTIQCRGVTMDEFASGLRRLAAAVYFENRPLVNSTGLEGRWDIDLKYPVRVTRISAAGTTSVENANGIFEAIEKQLGLRLELGTAPQPVLAVESVNEQPTPNAPGVDAALPPLPPPQFEVASLRICDTNERLVPPRFEPGGRVTATCVPLLTLLHQTLRLNPAEQPVGLPKWLDSGAPPIRVSIVAKAPAGTFPDTAGTGQAQGILDEMLRGLLVERYKLATHFEDRPMDAMTLVAVKPKLTKADPSARTGCTRQNQPASPVRIACKNITMTQFAEQILGLYPAARYPVVDNTHLEGAWDFTLEFNPAANIAQLLAQARARAGGPGAADAEASEPSGGPANIAEAMEKEIGLKLETHKRPEPVLVIDHIEEKPVE